MREIIRGQWGVIEEQYPVVDRETDKYVDYLTISSWINNRKDTTREKKFLCVGGPFHGEFWTRTQLRYACPGYKEFNNAGGSIHRAIFAWTEED